MPEIKPQKIPKMCNAESTVSKLLASAFTRCSIEENNRKPSILKSEHISRENKNTILFFAPGHFRIFEIKIETNVNLVFQCGGSNRTIKPMDAKRIAHFQRPRTRQVKHIKFIRSHKKQTNKEEWNIIINPRHSLSRLNDCTGVVLDCYFPIEWFEVIWHLLLCDFILEKAFVDTSPLRRPTPRFSLSAAPQTLQLRSVNAVKVIQLISHSIYVLKRNHGEYWRVAQVQWHCWRPFSPFFVQWNVSSSTSDHKNNGKK